MKPTLPAPWFATVLLCTFSSAQQTWIVNCHGGPGIDFTDLPPAVAAAAPGDTILVYQQQPWCPAAYTAPVIDKPLRIEGFTAYVTPPAPSLTPYPSTVGVGGLLTITGIPAGQHVIISNLTTVTFSSTPGPPSGILITDCAGDVLLEDYTYDSSGLVGYVLRIERCSNVMLRGCEFQLGGYPLTIEDSNVLLSTTLVDHVAPVLPPPFPVYTHTTYALSLLRSTATVIGSILRGNPDYGVLFGGNKPAVYLDQSTLRVGPSSYVRGVPLGGGQYTVAYVSANPATCAVLLDPRAVLTDPNNFGPPPIPTFLHATFHSWVTAERPFYADVAGPAGGFALLLLGDLSPTPIATPFGSLAIDPASAQPLELVYLPPPGGYYLWTFQCPANAPVAHPFALQALTLSPGGVFELAIPSPLTVGWRYGQIP